MFCLTHPVGAEVPHCSIEKDRIIATEPFLFFYFLVVLEVERELGSSCTPALSFLLKVRSIQRGITCPSCHKNRLPASVCSQAVAHPKGCPARVVWQAWMQETGMDCTKTLPSSLLSEGHKALVREVQEHWISCLGRWGGGQDFSGCRGQGGFRLQVLRAVPQISEKPESGARSWCSLRHPFGDPGGRSAGILPIRYHALPTRPSLCPRAPLSSFLGQQSSA